MNNLDLPPFPIPGASGPQACESVRFYLAIMDDLPFEQVRILSEHVDGCPGCAAAFQLLQKTTRMLADLPESVPSARVDDTILTFLSNQQAAQTRPRQLYPEKQLARKLQTSPAGKRTRSGRGRAGALALVAALVLTLALAAVFLPGLIWPGGGTTAFTLPSDLTWKGYVLHYTQSKNDAQGHTYQVEVYQDLGTNQMHIESTMPGKFDVVVVTDQQDMLGKDMMNHVAQKGDAVANWAVDGSAFDLGQLRQDLAAQRAVYLGQSTFMEQQVYQIRLNNNQILLLDMHYMPVNVLPGNSNTGASAPLYATCKLMLTAQVSDAMWNMQVPSNFRMGQLPAQS
ncbi:MAG TPA: hypothetical protein VF458_09590 [Ktedonobacteraceae bacterium]